MGIIVQFDQHQKGEGISLPQLEQASYDTGHGDRVRPDSKKAIQCRHTVPFGPNQAFIIGSSNSPSAQYSGVRISFRD